MLQLDLSTSLKICVLSIASSLRLCSLIATIWSSLNRRVNKHLLDKHALSSFTSSFTIRRVCGHRKPISVGKNRFN